MNSDRGHAFISYLREDSDRIDQLETQLEAAGIPVWRDVKSLWPGELWKQKLRQAIEERALAFIPCFSQAAEARTSSTMFEELRWAAGEYRRRNPANPWMFPVLLEDCRPPQIELGTDLTLHDLQWTLLFEDWEQQSERLITALTRIFPAHSKLDDSIGLVLSGLKPPPETVAGAEEVFNERTGTWGRWDFVLWYPGRRVGVELVAHRSSDLAAVARRVIAMIEPTQVSAVVVILGSEFDEGAASGLEKALRDLAQRGGRDESIAVTTWGGANSKDRIEAAIQRSLASAPIREGSWGPAHFGHDHPEISGPAGSSASEGSMVDRLRELLVEGERLRLYLPVVGSISVAATGEVPTSDADIRSWQEDVRVVLAARPRLEARFMTEPPPGPVGLAVQSHQVRLLEHRLNTLEAIIQGLL